MHPLEILQGYRLGGHRATVELQKVGKPGIHIDFSLLKLVNDIRAGEARSIVLTGTAGDGKTYLAYQVVDALELDRAEVTAAQGQGGYDRDGVYIDLDLSAGSLTEARVRRLHQVLTSPEKLTFVCANEGKLFELEESFRNDGLDTSLDSLNVNLSQRALVSPEAWGKVQQGVLKATFWDEVNLTESDILARNRAWLQNPTVVENIRRYLLLPYLLGEPITVREVLSFLAYVLTGDLELKDVEQIKKDEGSMLRYFIFNTLFSEPDGYTHGGRAVPGEKLLWWMFRFDPGATANPETDLQLLTQLEQIDVIPPDELLKYWQTELIAEPGEKSDTKYRKRVSTFMRYARRWYALFSQDGKNAYFPFQYFDDYVSTLSTPSQDLDDKISTLIKALNLLLSGGQVGDEYNLNLYHIDGGGMGRKSVIYSQKKVSSDEFQLLSDLALEDKAADVYLELFPRKLYLSYSVGADTDNQIRLPISLLLYEVLMGTASPDSGFKATLWAKERYTVARFMSALNQLVEKPKIAQFIISEGTDKTFKLAHNPRNRSVSVS